METPNQIQVTDEQLEEQLKELSSKSERTAEDEEKIKELKDERRTRYQKRVDTLTYRAKSAEEVAKQKDETIAQLQARLEALEEKETPPVVIKDETMEISGKKYYTDETLQSMIDAKKMSVQEANVYASKRDREQIKAELREEFQGAKKKSDEDGVRQKDMDDVFKAYPNFAKYIVNEAGEKVLNPKFNEEDPLYKEANRLYMNGYYVKPNGMSLAIADAKKMLRMEDRADTTDTVSFRTSAPENRKPAEQKTALTEDEKRIALNTWSGKVNPVTQRAYTEKEIIEKATKAKASRIRR